MKPDIGRKSRLLHTPPAFDAPVRGFPSEYCHYAWHRKTRVVLQPGGEKKLKIVMFIRFDRIHKRDGRIDRRTTHDGTGRAYTSIARRKAGQTLGSVAVVNKVNKSCMLTKLARQAAYIHTAVSCSSRSSSEKSRSNTACGQI